MNEHELRILLLIVLAAILAIGLLAHMHYFVRITNHIKRTSDRAFQKEDLKIALRIHQGSNFNTVMLFSWCLFVVAIAFLYFLTPEIFPNWNYFSFPKVASDSFGLAYFAAALIILPGILIGIFIPKGYKYYQISRPLKQATLIAPLLLLVSISSSIYLGTIYPLTDKSFWYLGYASLILALIVMLSPIGKGYLEELRA
jgi:CBS domain containing-hemolysin-like protein